MKTRLFTINALHHRPAGIFTVLGIVVAVLFVKPNPARSYEIENGARKLMENSRADAYQLLWPASLRPEIKVWVEADRALPEEIVYRRTVRRNEPPVRIAVHQRGSGTHPCVLVLIHGILASHESWRYLTGDLGEDFDLWVIDLPGCGDSGKPDPESLQPDGYGPTAIADRIFQALEQCLAARGDSPRIILVAHSLGGMIALRMMGDPELRGRYASVLERIDGLVMLAPADVNVTQEMPWATKIIELTDFKVGIGNMLGQVRIAAAESILDGFVSATNATRELADELCHVLVDPKHRHAARAMLIQAVPWVEKRGQRRSDPVEIRRLEGHYANIDVPCLIVWGQRDEIIPVSMGYKLQRQIPGAKLALLTNCMHSIELECPTVCTQLIRGLDAELHATSAGLRPAREVTAEIETLAP